LFRFGYATRDELPETMPTSGVRPALSMAMLAEFAEPLSERDSAAIDLIFRLEDERITYPKRHNVVDGLMAEAIKEAFPPERPVRIHEVAASSAITSLDLYETLKPLRPNVSVLATDRLVEMYVVSLPGSPWQVIFDGVKEPLQFVGRGMVISARRERRRYPINVGIQYVLRRTLLPKAERLLREGGESGSGNIRRISTFHPRAVALAQRDPAFTLGQADMFVALEGPFEVVRAMFAFVHWKSPEIRRALQGITAPLVDGGLLVVGERSLAGEQTVTIFKRQGDRFVDCRDVAGGTHDKQRVLEIRLRRSPDTHGVASGNEARP
jgi:hypothetical protein